MASSDIERGSKEHPIYSLGDYFNILKTLIDEGRSVYFILNELLLYLDMEAQKLKLVEVRSDDRVKILSAVAQTMALANEYNLWPEAAPEILSSRFEPLQV